MRTTVLVLTLSLALVSCGGGDPKEDAYAALGSGDHVKALANFDEALVGVEPSSAEYVELSVARCQALAHVDAQKALDDFKALSAQVTGSDRLTPSDFSLVVTELLDSDAEKAVLLMDTGLKRFPDSEKMVLIKDKVIETAKKRGDKKAQDALAGLGYLGGSDD